MEYVAGKKGDCLHRTPGTTKPIRSVQALQNPVPILLIWTRKGAVLQLKPNKPQTKSNLSMAECTSLELDSPQLYYNQMLLWNKPNLSSL